MTLKAQQSREYQDYLSRKGEDNNEHYFVKIEASELLMNHTSETFVTPVFSGSASLRNAAGQLIEEACKNARRNKELQIEELYDRINGLFQLDEIEVKQKEPAVPETQEEDASEQKSGTAETEETGDAPVTSVKDVSDKELPAESKALLIGLPVVWLGIGGYALLEKKKTK